MSEFLLELARRIEGQPWNEHGADKTWVLNAMATLQKFREEIRQAQRVRSH